MTFVLDRAVGAEILKVLAAEPVTQLAIEVAAGAGQSAVVETRVSKTRFVATVKVSAEEQAKNGILSRAASDAGLTVFPYKKAAEGSERKRVIGFVSKVQWRWAFWTKQSWARQKARETPGEKLIRYRRLPESTSTKPQ
ncbi:hypothetical protein [Mycolicibacterium sp.]|uniref:hypothetical protein n=1 Tax=Mycolicibacterium sp. TaxID=2320850 RepID=UPI0028A7A4B3|nr:hypothetical protein [Mycolicibacterium sp.]